ncbi:hypothetical protein M406DRAFT_71177 [Cryphonectria parasitica EP155]|uniref:Fork-head domain-containing protein n=1 Tax=Cryphonectria parasitica (strain ATCC 38755 / EP155) TaxID=660469 RepID=A0A9P5CNM3_CRYP1|nr:uncharacterized protein M406DRAFT_71177 [Cryphonectria parasitica EP155]KAF3764271.1 hypothetical protein M406DRAFT_71177 [Cryphonectria parasitica EP155]
MAGEQTSDFGDWSLSMAPGTFSKILTTDDDREDALEYSSHILDDLKIGGADTAQASLALLGQDQAYQHPENVQQPREGPFDLSHGLLGKFDSSGAAALYSCPESFQNVVPPSSLAPQDISALSSFTSEQKPFYRQGPPLEIISSEPADEIQFTHSTLSPYPLPCSIKPEVDTTEADLNFIPAVATSSSFSLQPYASASNIIPTTSLSPCNTSLTFGYDASLAMCQGQQTIIETGADGGVNQQDHHTEVWCPDNILEGSPSSSEHLIPKIDLPYAQLIYRAFMSRDTRSMTLQEMYQWFRENTDKAKSPGKGWMNSIRHNLSMNQAFVKRNAKAATRNRDGSLSFDIDAPGVDSRKSTEWFLHPDFERGVISTTRYRNDISGSRSRGGRVHLRSLRRGGGEDGGGASSATASSELGGRGDKRSGYSHARVSAGRKGGHVAAQNRRRQALQKQQEQQQARATSEAIRKDGPLASSYEALRATAMQYHGFPTTTSMTRPDGGLYSHMPGYTSAYNPMPTSSSAIFATAPTGFDGMTTTMEQLHSQTGRHLEMNYFNTQVAVDNEMLLPIERPGFLETNYESAEPSTPRSAQDPPHQQGNHSLVDNKHQEYLLASMGGGSRGGSAHLDQAEYSLADVTGLYEPGPDSDVQPPLFSDDILLPNHPLFLPLLN